MNNDALETLRAFGAQKVHEKTHISRKNIEAILNRSFEGIHRVQFAGFVSILEREYGLDLSELKAEFNAQWKAHHAAENSDEEVEAAVHGTETSGGGKGLLVGMLLAVVLLALWFFAPVENEPSVSPEAQSISAESTVIEPAVQTPEVVTEVAVAEEAAQVDEGEVIPPTLSIIPKSKLWMGFIDLETFERTQELTSEPVILDTNRSWLMIFGHGHFKVEQGEESFDFGSDNRLRFIYENGVLREISRVEFKERNRGQNW